MRKRLSLSNQTFAQATRIYSMHDGRHMCSRVTWVPIWPMLLLIVQLHSLPPSRCAHYRGVSRGARELSRAGRRVCQLAQSSSNKPPVTVDRRSVGAPRNSRHFPRVDDAWQGPSSIRDEDVIRPDKRVPATSEGRRSDYAKQYFVEAQRQSH